MEAPTGAAHKSSSRPSRSSQGAAATAIAVAPTLRHQENHPLGGPGHDYTADMLRGRSAAVAAALAIAAAATVTAGCGGGSTSSALSLDPVAAAATKTQDAGAARIRFSLVVSAPQLGKTLRMRGAGAIDGTSAQLSFKLGSMLGQMGLPSSATAAQLQHATIKEIALEENGDYVIYMRLGFLSSQLPGGKQWIKLDVSKLGKAAGLDLGKLLSGSQFQPGDMLGMLTSEGAKIQKVGPATVDGVATTHYRATIDLARALRSKGLTSPLLNGITAQMKTANADVWIGKDGLVRRIRVSYNVPHGATPMRMAMTMSLYDYGADLSIAAPPSSQVFDATSFAQQGLGSLH